ncbi:serine hydrolase-like protein 2 isoform X2 [Protopterus annectens]|nr:serine hydrolase-like protein 2 isoform X2 [Protopterus annectens]XP_043916925.1 serine hydrolase-like protein 2 isoform X2 [Protopterus annectens]
MPLNLPHVCGSAVKGLFKEFKFAVPWGHIAAKSCGPPQGRPVLCLHGWLDNANSFDGLIPLLPKDNYYVAIDFPGHGLSSHRPNGVAYNFLEYISDVRRVVERLEWNKFVIMGHSMGGNVGGLFSCIFPDMVERLILLDSCGFVPYRKDKLVLQMQKGIEALLKWEKQEHPPKVYSPLTALQRLLKANTSLSEASAQILLQRGATEVPGGLVFNRDFRINLDTPYRTPLEQCLEYQKKIQASVLIILAKNGILWSKYYADETSPFKAVVEGYKTAKSEFRLEIVEGDHHVHLNEPEHVAGIITDFLSKDATSKL